MEEYSTKKKDLLDEILQATNKDPIISEYISIHKEVLDTKENLVNSAHYTTVVSKINSLSDAVDDFEIKSCVTERKCPLTQEKIKNPFYSTCGHVFERSAIKNFLKASSNCCPTVGCKKRIEEKK
ncbi:E3 SUMO-protein ligase nse2 [Nosema granulosis]|uniref:E3 SUMO-protein ligase nse2 n=1 Tax=Nosema granulosis TaxID=83296 RepID=A0A9P6GXI7_9MICR|nr:E3 SUMO-protein ligase nse2 [Nosema granulosis]